MTTDPTSTKTARERLTQAVEQAKVDPQRSRRDKATSPWAAAPRRRVAAWPLRAPAPCDLGYTGRARSCGGTINDQKETAVPVQTDANQPVEYRLGPELLDELRAIFEARPDLMQECLDKLAEISSLRPVRWRRA
jgi:hypothetical protein